MRRTLSTLALSLAAMFAVSPALAGTNPHITAHPTARITAKVDNTKLTPVANTHMTLRSDVALDMGRVPAGTQLNHMMLVLKPTDDQEYALHTLLDQQQDKASENYHQWMTPDTFGAAFGIAQSDIAQVNAWLQDQGFTVNSVAKGGRIITFSGTSGQVETAFHTEMHRYSVNGEMHMSNSTDISIPTALSSVVLGPNRLNDFKPKSDAKALRVQLDPNTHKVVSSEPFSGIHSNTSTPGSTNFPNGEFVGGSDLAVIYDTNPLFAKGIQGQGVTLGIIGQTDVLLSDIQIYRSIYGLPINNYTRIQVGSDPGIIADDTESDLDLEVSGAMAPLANQIFYTSGNSYFGGGVDSAVEYVIEDNAADIFSMSYGECEGELGAADNAFFSEVYEQGAAQGQSFFISSGDDGPDTCGAYFSATGTPQDSGYTVNGLGSTPYNVSVGGTQFNEGASYNTASTATTGTPYWSPFNTAVPYESALSFIPDQPWNESVFGTGTYGGLTAGGSGISFYYGTPSWQVGPGVPTVDPPPPAGSYENPIPAAWFSVPGPHRYMPDVSLNAAVYHDGTVLCSEGSCTLTPSGSLYEFGIVGGTSVASPTMAGAQALINQMNGGRQGNPNYYYYRAAAVQSATACVASAYVATAGCSFHDSQAGNTDVPAVRNSTTLEIGWNTGVGYDLAVGLDSPDVANLAKTWSTINFNATTTALTASPVTGGTPGGLYNLSVAVAPVSGTGTPTGDVAIIAQALYGGLGYITLANGAGSATFSGFPAGTYCLYAHYEGDTKFGGSNSPCTTITVSQSTPTVAAVSESLVGTALTPTAQFAYGTNVYINMGVLPAGTGYGIPTGTMTVNLNNGTPLTPYSTYLDPNGTEIGTQVYPAGAYFDAGLGLTAYDIASTYPVLAPGTYTANVSYSGDPTFLAANAPPFTFVVGPYATTLKLTASTPDITSGGTAVLYGTITTIDPTVGGVPATGTVTFTDTTTAKVLGTATMTNGAVTFSTTGITQTGANTISASFAGTVGAAGGASYYTVATAATATVTVTTGTTTTTVVSPQTVAYQVLNAVAIPATVAAATSGTVYFFDSISGSPVEIGTGTVSATTHIATLSIATLIAGTHPITATYGGTTTLAASSTTAAVNYIVGQNVPTITLSAQTNGNVGVGGYAENAVLALNPTNGTRAANPAPLGVVNFLDAANGAAATTLGSATAAFLPNYEQYDANFTTSALVPGYHVLSAKLGPDPNYASSTSNTLSVQIGITTTKVTASVSRVGTNIPFTLTAIVTPVIASSTAVVGTVNFYYGGTILIGSATAVNGVATLTTASIPVSGLESVTAVYLGNSTYYTSTSAAITVTTIIPSFSMSVTPSSLNIVRGTAGSATLTITTVGDYAGTFTFSCAGLPAYSYCNFPPTVIAPATGTSYTGTNDSLTQNVAMTIATTAPTPEYAGGLLWIPALFFAGLLLVRRKQLSGRTRNLIALAVIFCGVVALSGCGNGVTRTGIQNGTPLGAASITVTSTGAGTTAASPTTTGTASLTINVVAQ
jgi:hypothetical protein